MHSVTINNDTYANRAPAEAQTTSYKHSKSAKQYTSNAHAPIHSEPDSNSGQRELPLLQTTEQSSHEAKEAARPATNDKVGRGREPCVSATAKAFVSYCSNEMLVARVLIAGELQEAHLDSCASYCFISSAMSKHLTTRGYPPESSPVCFEVKQGNPLCDTDSVHFVPLSIVLESGAVCTWDDCLFLVADAGAPIILCYSLLRLGGILSYEPPRGYEQMLERIVSTANTKVHHSTPPQEMRARNFAAMRRGMYYHAPSRTTPPATPRQSGATVATKCLTTHSVSEGYCRPEYSNGNTTGTWVGNSTKRAPENGRETLPLPSSNTRPARAPTFGQQPHLPEAEQMTDRGESGDPVVVGTGTKGIGNPSGCKKPIRNPSGEGGGSSTGVTPNTSPKKNWPTPLLERKKCKGETDMLTPENPYGRNPPLPEEVLKAVNHLKLLSNPNTAPTYTHSQIEEIRSRFQEERPRWVNCLTLDQTSDVSDKETEQFLYDLMDKPKYQTSIFSSNLSKCCDLREYELNQFPGRDLWTPPQPCKYKNPVMAKIVDDWLDFLLENNKARESTATHPARVTIVHKESREPRVCVDYRNRNARTEVPIFPMLDLGDFLV